RLADVHTALLSALRSRGNAAHMPYDCAMNDGLSLRPPRVAGAGCANELALWRAGYSRVAGIDEVGRGPLAGPVVAGAVILPPFFEAPWLAHVRDSKTLTARQRERLAVLIRCHALAYGVGLRPARVIDEAGLAAALR